MAWHKRKKHSTEEDEEAAHEAQQVPRGQAGVPQVAMQGPVEEPAQAQETQVVSGGGQGSHSGRRRNNSNNPFVQKHS